ncbi:MAG: ATP-binding cassette domain-containing protein [Gemmatimonadales bacterium]
MSLLSLDNVSKQFNRVTAVDHVSFSVGRGEVVGFLGPNGAGKSTTMRMITQFLDPDQGSIAFDGVLLAESGESPKRRIGYLPENNPLYGEMLVAEYLEFVAALHQLRGPDAARAIDEAVQSTAIDGVYYRPIAELSKGYRQRVGLAAAILHHPDLLVLDEPTEGLDPNQRVEIRHLIGALGKDRTVLLSTHVLPEVETTCSRLLIINAGKLVADGPVTELLDRARGAARITVEAAGTGIAEALRAIAGTSEVDARTIDGRTRATLTVTDGTDKRPEIFRLAVDRQWTLYELHQEAGSLEHLFRELTTTPAGGTA